MAAGKMLVDPWLASQLEVAARNISEAFKKGNKIIICGNGGSAADAQHFAAEFVGRYLKERKALPAIALTTNSSILTAIANDYGYEYVFSRQVEALANKGDVVIGISTSGNSSNIVYALDAARKKGCYTIGLVGSKQCRIDSAADLVIKAPSENTPRIQEMHIFLIHMICELVEDGV
jgi:D-sedoheptulose 7-phosphate isomerase